MKTVTRWYHYLAYFFGGAFLANSLPHLGNGISGHAFQSPFATPPGVGLSSSTVNVLWGLFNLAVGYLLVCRVGNFELRKTRHVLVLGAGVLIFSVLLARGFGRFHGGAVSLATGSVFNVGDLHKGAQTICLDIVGVRSLAVHAKDDSAAALYRHF